MPLTSADVRAVQFATTRMRMGYDMDEVDAFLDIIEADVAQYADDLQRARDGEAVLRAQGDQLQSRVVAAERRIQELEGELAAAQRTAASHAEPVQPEVTQELQEMIADDPEAATIVAVAQRTADEIVRYAQNRADGIRASVRTMLEEQRELLDRD